MSVEDSTAFSSISGKALLSFAGKNQMTRSTGYFSLFHYTYSAANWILFLVLIGVLLPNPAMAGVASFHGLGDGPVHYVSSANAVSADGSVVVGKVSTPGTQAFRWTANGGMVGLGDLQGGSTISWANATSADGSIVVGQGHSALGYEAFRWTADSGMEGLGDFPGGGYGSVANGVSADGSIVVGQGSNDSGSEAFRWTDGGGIVGLGRLNASDNHSNAISVSADGSVIVGVSDSNAFRWTADGGMVGLGDLPGGVPASRPAAISADGGVVVGWSISASGIEAFQWTETEGMIGLGDLPGGSFHSEAKGLSADGSIIVGTASGQIAFIWDIVNGMRSIQDILVSDFGLDLTGWHLSDAIGISADGTTIVGNGINSMGNSEAWIATIPEPATFLLLALGCIVALRRRVT